MPKFSPRVLGLYARSHFHASGEGLPVFDMSIVGLLLQTRNAYPTNSDGGRHAGNIPW